MKAEQSEKSWNKSPLILRLIGMGTSYFVKTPWWLKQLYPKRLWSVNTKEKIIYLTFDDGPHPLATPFVLDELKKHNAKATFFCIGKNVMDHPDIYKRILEEGHAVGNHTQNHLNGWKTENDTYLANVSTAAKHISTNLFRPPYGRVKSGQAKKIANAMNITTAEIVMWDILSGDFDETLSPENCLKNATSHTNPGAIIVFHDSEKAFSKLSYALPGTINYFLEKGYRFEKL